MSAPAKTLLIGLISLLKKKVDPISGSIQICFPTPDLLKILQFSLFVFT